MLNEYSEEYVSGFVEGYRRAESAGRKAVNEACSLLGTAVLDNLLATFDGYEAKGRSAISVEDAKMETCICVGRLFKKS